MTSIDIVTITYSSRIWAPRSCSAEYSVLEVCVEPCIPGLKFCQAGATNTGQGVIFGSA